MAKKKDDTMFLVVMGLVVLVIIVAKLWKKNTLNEILYVAEVIIITVIILGLIALALYLWWKKVVYGKPEEIKETPKPIEKQKKEVEKEPEKEIEQKIIQEQVIPKEKPEKKVEKPKIKHQKKEIFHEKPFERQKEAKQEEVKIRIDFEDTIFHKASKLSDYEIEYLQRRDFKIKDFFNPFKRKKERFVFKKNPIESDSHFLTIYLIADFLKGKVDNLKTFQTKKPDITFKFKNKKYAIEVETGKIHSKSKKQLQEKVDLLNQNYDKWFFVVIKRNFVARYRKFGKVIDARYLKNQLKKLVSK